MIETRVSDTKFQIDSLDGLRGMAALIVVFSHTSNVGWYFFPFLDFSGTGKSGVYLFFVLSAFLLALPMLSKGSGVFTSQFMKYYWSRRVFRVWPLYGAYLLTALISSFLLDVVFGPKTWGVPFRLELHEFINHLLLFEGKGVTWSIAVEFKFYFVLPLIVFFSGLLLWHSLFASLVAVVFCILYFLLAFPPESFSATDARLGPFFPVFLIGIMAAVIQHKINISNVQIEPLNLVMTVILILAIFGLICLIPSVYSELFQPVKRDYFAKDRILHSSLWVVALLCLVNCKNFISRFLETPPMRYLGMISFGVYLIHPIFIDMMRHFNIETHFNAWIVLVGTLAVSHISFKFYEKRFMVLSKGIGKS